MEEKQETFKQPLQLIPSTSKYDDSKKEEENQPPSSHKNKINLFTEITGPQWHTVCNDLVTPPIIATNLQKVFEKFPIFDKPKNKADLEDFYDRTIRKFVGCDLDDSEYDELKNYCSPELLKTGKELTMTSKVPITGTYSPLLPELNEEQKPLESPNLFVLRKLKTRMEQDPKNVYARKLKYKGFRIFPLDLQEDSLNISDLEPPDLDPGRDIVYRIRVYRPFMFSWSSNRASQRGRPTVFSCDVVVLGRHPVSVIRDRIFCKNNYDMRVDVSDNPDIVHNTTTTAKDIFPSGFLFINNVLYTERDAGGAGAGAGRREMTGALRRWAAERGLGDFPVRDMNHVRLQDIRVRLAHPEVYVHQGNCEHVFLFSEVRLLNYSDPLHLSVYPCNTAFSQNQTIYCTTCAEFGAKWIVTGCNRVPFDPAFFCDTCFKQYLYKDGKKIGDFKAYSYRGNEVNILKQQPS